MIFTWVKVHLKSIVKFFSIITLLLVIDWKLKTNGWWSNGPLVSWSVAAAILASAMIYEPSCVYTVFGYISTKWIGIIRFFNRIFLWISFFWPFLTWPYRNRKMARAMTTTQTQLRMRMRKKQLSAIFWLWFSGKLCWFPENFSRFYPATKYHNNDFLYDNRSNKNYNIINDGHYNDIKRGYVFLEKSL